MSNEPIHYSYAYEGDAPIVYMGTGLVEVQRATEHDPEADGRAPEPAELRTGDVLVVSELLGVDALHFFLPADKATEAATDLLLAVEPPESTETAPEEPGEAPYPEGGTKDEILAWVGDDPAKAREAMHNEAATGSPRRTLTDALERLVINQEG